MNYCVRLKMSGISRAIKILNLCKTANPISGPDPSSGFRLDNRGLSPPPNDPYDIQQMSPETADTPKVIEGDQKNKSSSSGEKIVIHNVMSQRKKTNWFCNRGLSPPPNNPNDIQSTLPETDDTPEVIEGDQKNKSSSSGEKIVIHNVMSYRKNTNWFCNRGLSPPQNNPNDIQPTLPETGDTPEVIEGNQKNASSSPAEKIVIHNVLSQIKKTNWFCNRGLSPPSNYPNDIQPMSPESADTPKVTEADQKNKSSSPADKIVIHEVMVINPPAIRGNQNSNIVNSSLKNKKSNENFYYSHEHANLESEDVEGEVDLDELIPPTPQDPYYSSEHSDYYPSDEEEDSDSMVTMSSSRELRNTKKTCSKNNNNKNEFHQTNQNNQPMELILLNNEKENSLLLLQSTPSFPLPIEVKENDCSLSNYELEKSSQKIESVTSDFNEVQKDSDISNTKKPYKYKRKPDYCYYCENVVQNFTRHIGRNHSTEFSVGQILSKPIKSKERRHLLDNLRRKGNFLASGKSCFKAVRRSSMPDRSLLPCDNCLGYFSSKILYRHRKKCLGGGFNGKAQAAGQSKLVTNRRIDKRLSEQVFPRMRADKVSLEAKNDALICAFGARYINVHREKHFINVTSRKMRELSKVLIELRKIVPSISDMFSALQPKNFDYFIEAVKRIAKYDAEKDIFLSPTFAMNIVTSLKQCCDIAITYAYKKDVTAFTVSSAEAEANLKTLIHLFESNWRFEISSQAANDLSLNKWNKVTIIPLATDLKLLRQHLIRVAEDAIRKLKQNDDISAYNNLVESLYCRIILLNRKRSGELQRMPLYSYINNSSEKEEYEEFKNVVSPAEQILLKSLKRVVIRGKRGRGVPVLFSSDVQDNINFLLNVRDKFVSKENIYLFAKGNSLMHIIGHKTLSKHAYRCGAKNPTSITSTRLRKHLATLSQLFNLSDSEIEQLATFMGHTPGVHRNAYRLPDDIFQTAKISKLLMVMEKGGADEFKGKTLDDVNVDMEENLLNDKNDESDVDDIIEDILPKFEEPEPVPSTSTAFITSTAQKTKKLRTLVPWTAEQKKVTKLFFKKHIQTKKPPKRGECEELKEKHPELLENKNCLKIKVYIQNEYKKNGDK